MSRNKREGRYAGFFNNHHIRIKKSYKGVYWHTCFMSAIQNTTRDVVYKRSQWKY